MFKNLWKKYFQMQIFESVFVDTSTKLVWVGTHDSQVNIGSGYGLVAVRQQAITWANVDQYRCRHMKSLGPNELKELFFHLLTELYDEKIGLVNEASGGPSTAPPEGMLYNYSWDQHVQTHRNKLLHDLSYRVASFISLHMISLINKSKILTS